MKRCALVMAAPGLMASNGQIPMMSAPCGRAPSEKMQYKIRELMDIEFI